LWIPDRNLYTYPDVMVVEKPLQLQTGRTDTVTNPCFIAEVLRQFKSEVHQRLIYLNRILQMVFYSQATFSVYC
jgi:Uma2 family endonuclease